jgi:CPA1 family monovalent cation:H+ antiporter
VAHLEGAKERDSEQSAATYDDLVRHYRQRLASLQPHSDSEEEAADHDRQVGLSLEALRVERETVIRLRDQGRINDEVLRRIERELDLSEARTAAEGEA